MSEAAGHGVRALQTGVWCDKQLVLAVARWPVGGIRTYLRDLFAASELDGYEFILLAPDIDEIGEYWASGALRCRDWIRTPSSPVGYVDAIAKAVRRLRPLLVHSHGFESALFSGVACFHTRCHHLLTVHDVLLDGQFVGLRGRVREAILGIGLRLPDRIHCVTHDSRANLVSRYPWIAGTRYEVEVIPHGVDICKIQGAAPRDVRTELGCDPNTVILGFLGRFMAQKGFRVLMDAVALLKERGLTPRHFRVLAVGSGGFLREDQVRLSTMALTDFFTFWPYEPDISSILKGIDCLVMPSLWEASGLLAMEAIVAGTPVIGTSCIGLRETLAGTPAALVPPGDAETLSRAIDHHMRSTHKEAALQFQTEAAARFDARRAFAKLSELYARYRRPGA